MLFQRLRLYAHTVSYQKIKRTHTQEQRSQFDRLQCSLMSRINALQLCLQWTFDMISSMWDAFWRVTYTTPLSLRKTWILIHRRVMIPNLTQKKIYEMLFAHHFISIISHFRGRTSYYISKKYHNKYLFFGITCSEACTIRPITIIKKYIYYLLT